mmetsp:Transcript_115569/g.338073  ORF Transcript_115569/g.338073 Transcript_115569/m.338073 type:complete len:140 (+) Transcript_115569:625-1044(+)
MHAQQDGIPQCWCEGSCTALAPEGHRHLKANAWPIAEDAVLLEVGVHALAFVSTLAARAAAAAPPPQSEPHASCQQPTMHQAAAETVDAHAEAHASPHMQTAVAGQGAGLAASPRRPAPAHLAAAAVVKERGGRSGSQH